MLAALGKAGPPSFLDADSCQMVLRARGVAESKPTGHAIPLGDLELP